MRRESFSKRMSLHDSEKENLREGKYESSGFRESRTRKKWRRAKEEDEI